MVFQNGRNFPTHPQYGHLFPERIASLEAKDHITAQFVLDKPQETL